MRRRVSILIAVVLLASARVFAVPQESIEWRPVINAVVKVDDRPARIWDLFVASKRKDIILLQLGSRFILLDLDDEKAAELLETSLTRKGVNLYWKLGEGQTLLESEEWTQRNAGPARVIRLRVVKEGRRIEVQVPIKPDLRKFY